MADEKNNFIDSLIYGDETKPVEVVTEQEPPKNEEVKTEVLAPETKVDVEPEKPKEEQANTETSWLSELAKNSNNEITSQEGLLAVLESSKKYANLESEHTTLKEQYETAKKNEPKFASDYMRKLNELELSGDKEKVKLFQKVNSIGDVKEMTAMDAEKLHLQWKYNLTPEEAKVMIDRDYKLDEDLYTDEEIAQSRVALKIKGEEAKEYLKSMQASTEVTPLETAVPQLTEAELKAQETAKAEALKPMIKSIEQDLPNLFKGVNTNGLKDDKARLFDLPVSSEVQKEVIDKANSFAMMYNLDPSNAEHSKALKEFAHNTAKFLLYDAHIIDAANKAEEKVRAEFNNPSNINRGVDNPNAPKLTGHDKVIAELLA